MGNYIGKNVASDIDVCTKISRRGGGGGWSEGEVTKVFQVNIQYI